MFQKILIISIFLLLTGCTSARISQSLASGAIGCPMDEIHITNETATMEGLHNFTATCGGIEHFCSYMYPNPINCKSKNERALVTTTPPVIENKIVINNVPAKVIQDVTEYYQDKQGHCFIKAENDAKKFVDNSYCQ